MRLTVDWVGGLCPVQAEGRIDDAEFYFRARGDSWSLSVGGDDVIGEPDWYHEEDYGDGPYDAGWMTEDEARGFIEKAARLYMERSADSDGQPDEAKEWRDFDPEC